MASPSARRPTAALGAGGGRGGAATAGSMPRPGRNAKKSERSDGCRSLKSSVTRLTSSSVRTARHSQLESALTKAS